MTKSESSSAEDDNQVFLRGRLAAGASFRELPSGDVLAVFRITVKRPPGDRVKVDSIECTTSKARVHKTLTRLNAGDEIEVSGRLHRRFWRSPAGPASRYSVEAAAVRSLTKSGRGGGAGRGRTPASA